MSFSRRKFLLSLVPLLSASGARAADLALPQLAAAADYSESKRGLSMLVLQHGKPIFSRYSAGSSAGVPQKIYSGTKGFWVLAAIKAQEEGIIQWDEPVSATLPEWRDQPQKARVTLRQLLDFTSGLDAEFHLHSDKVADRNGVALKVPMVARTGERFIYGPAALQVFDEVLKRKLAARHGMTPTFFLERHVLRPLGLGTQEYRSDQMGNPLLAAGFKLTAEQWARMGQLMLKNGAPVVASMAPAFEGTRVNPAFGMGFWNNRAAALPGAREFDFEQMLERSRDAQDWSNACICRAAPPDLVASVGSGYQRLFVIPSMDLIVVRQGLDAHFSDGEFLRRLLGR